MSSYLQNGFLASASLLMIGLYFAAISGFSPHLAYSGIISFDTEQWILNSFPAYALFSGLIAMIVLLLSGMADAAFSKNNNTWKAKWIIIIIGFQLIGLVLYYVVGAKHAKRAGRRR